ncbi:MAG: FtsX-like permease family protein [Sphingobacteriales bacterium]|nr:MAG: FtsX-like permease family protein [Sphingobacteriales bacterium]
MAAASYGCLSLRTIFDTYFMPSFASTLATSVEGALSELRSNKLRSALSLLGITIGIFCIVAVLTVLDSMQTNIRKEVASLGSDVLYVGRWPWTDDGGVYKWWEYMNRPSIGLTELRTIEKQIPAVSAASLVVATPVAELQRGTESVSGATAYAVASGFDRLQNIEVESGRYLTPAELDGGVATVVLGRTLYESLFPEQTDALGTQLPFEGKRFRIVGILKKVGRNAAGFDFDNAFIYPYQAATINFKSPDYDPMLIVKAQEATPVADLEIEVEGALRSIRKVAPGQPNNFAINQLSQISQQLDSLFGVINGIGWLIGGFSLVVGLFGIANIMFVTVKERTRFIGLKKAIGARRLDILTEFLIEAVVLCLIGGIIGLVLVGLLGLLMSKVFDFPVALSLKNVFIGMSVSTVVGLLAGFIPARRASRLNPVVAIRSN